MDIQLKHGIHILQMVENSYGLPTTRNGWTPAIIDIFISKVWKKKTLVNPLF